VPVRTAHDPGEFRKALEWAFASDSSAIVEAVIDSREYDGVVLKKDKP
jgi:acetolactate synthase-1/2/3 large subunit